MNHSRYGEYKDSGAASLGEVPCHWDVVPIRRFVMFKNGADYKHVEVADGGYPVIGSGGAFRRASEYMYDGESVLFGRKGTVDKPLHVRGRFWTVDTMYYTDIDTRHLLPRFLYYWALRVPYGYYITSTALPSMTQTDLGSARIALPSIKEQQVIAAYLDRETAEIDAFISDQEELIGLLNERRTATITQAVTRGLNPDTPMKQSGLEWLGAVPQHWRILKLAWVATCSSGKAISSEDVEITATVRHEHPVIGGNGVMGFAPMINVSDPLLVVGRVGALCGNVHLVDVPAWITDNALRLTVNDSYDLRYLAHVLRARKLNDLADKTAQPLITGTLVSSQRLPAPPLEEQVFIADVLSRETAEIDAAISDARAAIALSRERRAAVISAAVTGKIDVRDRAKTKGEPVGVA